MFKNLIIYRIAPTWQMPWEAAEAALQKAPFHTCGATQEQSSGFVPPRGEAHGALLESVAGQWIARFMTESKMLPASVLARKVEEKAARIEQETGRNPGKKERRDLKDEARLDLLPMAFTKQGSTWVWIDPEARFLCIDASSQSRADEISSVLTELWPGFALSLLDTQAAPQAAMASWLVTQEPPDYFSIGRECELKSADESKATVRYGRHPLDIAEVQQHIKQEKLPTKLALTWNNSVSFALTEGLQLKKIELLDVALENQSADDSGFDADVAIATGELAKLIPDLVEALGGEWRSQ